MLCWSTGTDGQGMRLNWLVILYLNWLALSETASLSLNFMNVHIMIHSWKEGWLFYYLAAFLFAYLNLKMCFPKCSHFASAAAVLNVSWMCCTERDERDSLFCFSVSLASHNNGTCKYSFLLIILLPLFQNNTSDLVIRAGQYIPLEHFWLFKYTLQSVGLPFDFPFGFHFFLVFLFSVICFIFVKWKQFHNNNVKTEFWKHFFI